MEYYPPPSCLPSMNIRNFLEDESERHWKGPFTFVQGADTQFGMFNIYHPLTTKHSWDRDLALAKDFVKAVNKMNPKPRFVAICGDMLDAYPHKVLPSRPIIYGEKSGAGKVRDRQYKDFVEVFRKLSPEIKLICTCGNHDMGDIPTFEALQVYREQFGSDYFSFWVGGVKFAVLNSQYLESPKGLPEETIKHDKFIDSIPDSNAKFIVTFQHIPFFVKSLDEANTRVSLPTSVRHRYLERLYQAGVRYVFCGHTHFNGGGFYKDLEQVVTAPIGCPTGLDPSGYRVVNVDEEGISHKYFTLRDTPDWGRTTDGCVL